MKVTVLVISHRYGDSISAYASQELAWEDLENYCRYWWESELPDEPMPAEDEDIVTDYFDLVGNEWWEMETVEIIEKVEPLKEKAPAAKGAYPVLH